MGSFNVKEKLIGLVVSEIFQYKQTYIQTKIMLLYYKE